MARIDTYTVLRDPRADDIGARVDDTGAVHLYLDGSRRVLFSLAGSRSDLAAEADAMAALVEAATEAEQLLRVRIAQTEEI